MINNSNEQINYLYYIKNINEYNVDYISIDLEIKRFNIINNLIELFKLFIKKININNKYIIYNKNFIYNKINEYVQRWCWLQYNISDIVILDIVIPYNSNNNYDFTDFIDFINYNLETTYNLDDEIFLFFKNDIINYLKKSYIDELYNNINYYNLLNINIIDKINKLSITLIYNKVKINFSLKLYYKLCDKFKKFSNENIKYMNIYIFCLIFRYSYMESGNQQLAINDKIKSFFKKVNVNFELYGSAINSSSDHYCSLYYDIEKHFGSKGNFFDIELEEGVYWCNPPYNNTILTNTAYKIIEYLNSNKKLIFIITIPIWDNETKKIINNYSNVTRYIDVNKDYSIYNDYLIYFLLKPYIKDELIIPKYRIPYFNFRLNKYIYAVDTYMLIVYNYNFNNLVNKYHKIFDNIIDLDKNNYFIV